MQDDGNADGDPQFGGEKLIKFGVPSDLVVTVRTFIGDRTSHSSSEGVRTIVDESITYLQGFLSTTSGCKYRLRSAVGLVSSTGMRLLRPSGSGPPLRVIAIVRGHWHSPQCTMFGASSLEGAA